MTVQGTMTRNTSRGEHADELFHPKPAKAPLGCPVVKTGQTRPSAVRFKTGQSALGSDAPSEPPSRLVKSTRRNYCESSCSNHVHWPVFKRPSVAGFQAPLDISPCHSCLRWGEFHGFGNAPAIDAKDSYADGIAGDGRGDQEVLRDGAAILCRVPPLDAYRL
jgi:hypothetical protein